jgi:outer membrane protein assembly factor BamB
MRKIVSLFGCALLIFLLFVGSASAEYPLFHHDAQRTGFVSDSGPGENSTLRWSSHLGEFIGAPPVVDGGRVYVGVWPDMDFQPGEEYSFFCLDVASGTVIWKNPLGPGEGTVSGAAVSGDRVYVGCMDGKLYCIDKTDGTTLWSTRVDIGEPDGNWYGLASCPVVYNDRIYVTSLTDGTLHVFDTTGTEVWKYATGKQIFAYSSPAIDNDRVYFGTNSATSSLYCVDINTHTALWSITSDGGVKSSPVISGDSVFFTTTNNLEAVNKGNGSLLWSRPISSSWGTPAVAGGHLYLGTRADSALHCFSTSTGANEWTFTTNGKVDTSPVVAGDTVYFASNCATGTIYAVDTSGKERWHHTTTNYVMSSPSVSDGALFIGSDEGTLYAFGGAYVPLQKIPGSFGLPTDPNGDGLYEDMNGNGALDFNDVVLFFNQMDWIADNEPIRAFDFNADGQIDFNDIVMLFNSL